MLLAVSTRASVRASSETFGATDGASMSLRPQRTLKYWMPTKAGLLAILVFAWIVSEVLDPYRGSWLWRVLFSDSVVVALTLDVSVDGERLELSRAIRCVQYYSATLPRSGQVNYRAVEAIGWKLASGGALLLIVPRVCGLRGKIEGSDGKKRMGLRKIHPDHLPLLAWIADTDDPQPVEAYVSQSAYDREGARLQFHGISARIDSSAIFADDRDQFEWFRQSQGGPYQPKIYGPRLRHFYAGKVPEELWRRVPALVDFAKSTKHSSFLPKHLRGPISKGDPGLKLPSWGEIMHGFGIPPGPSARGDSTGRQGSRGTSFGDIIPFRRDGDAFVLSPEDQGKALLYPPPIATRRHLHEHRFKVGQEVIQPTGGLFDVLYDAQAQEMYWVQTWHFLPWKEK